MEIKKEWLIDRTNTMLIEIEQEINRLQEDIKKSEASVKRMESDFRDREDRFYADAINGGLDEKEARWQLDGVVAENNSDPLYTITLQQIDSMKLRLTALKQDKEIYEFYLKSNSKS